MYSIYPEYSGRLAQQPKITQPDHGLHFLPICDYIHILHISKWMLTLSIVSILLLSHPGILGLCNLTLKSSTDILGENNARRLLKSVQNPEILINNMSVNMSDYFINTLTIKRKSHF